MEQTIKNIFVATDEENTVVYSLTCTCAEIRRFFETALGIAVNDCYEVKDEELQYYCIDGRVWLDEKKEAILRKKIS